MRNHQPGQTQAGLIQHKITQLATQAYENHGGGTDEGLIAFLLNDIVYQQRYLTRRLATNQRHLVNTRRVEKRIAIEAALVERLRQQQKPAEKVLKWKLRNNATIYAHRECSINPEFEVPDWKQAEILDVEDVLANATCTVCTKGVKEDPPVYWSRLTIEELSQARAKQRRTQQPRPDKQQKEGKHKEKEK